eukprot:scaffold50915_cov66-Phaeocystis_antarctica.AAC.9
MHSQPPARVQTSSGLAAGRASMSASRTQTEDGSLLRVPQEVLAAHMTASLPTFWPARHTMSWMAPGACRGRPRAR